MTKREAQAAVHLARAHNAKMPCMTYGVPPELSCFWRTWPEKHQRDVLTMPDQICSHCYARRGHYRHMQVKGAQIERFHAMRDNLGWAEAMVRALVDEEYFRFFDAGDCESHTVAGRIMYVVKHSPDTKFWISTKMAQYFTDHQHYSLSSLSNLCVRQGIQVIDELPTHVHTLMRREPSEVAFALVMRDPDTRVYPGAHICPATTVRKSCGDCRACWDREQKLVIYKLH